MTPLPDLHSLPREMPPPPELESRVVAALRAQALVNSPRRPSWTYAAAAVLLLASGIVIGRVLPRSSTTDARPGSTARFLFLLTDADISGNDAARAEAYRRWAVQQRDAGREISGERLADRGVAVVSQGAAPIARVDVQGYFVVSASGIDDAVAVARSSPHVQSGGTIIVRPIDTP